ncbi:MAG: DUF2892 domain-containing protein [Bacteroidota bacterium]|nr:DUF2892 domain-containing protein [Bacteroidota bacterium]
MQKNMGRADRSIRFVVGLVLIVLYFMDIISGTVGTIGLVFAIVLLGTSFVGVCGLYLPFQFRTCEPE